MRVVEYEEIKLNAEKQAAQLKPANINLFTIIHSSGVCSILFSSYVRVVKQRGKIKRRKNRQDN